MKIPALKIVLENQPTFTAAFKAARTIAADAGVDWLDVEVFVTYREPGRYGIKHAGFRNISAGG